MKNPISLAMPPEATFTAVLVCAKDGRSEPSASPTAVKARPSNMAAKRDLGRGLDMSFRSGADGCATMRHGPTSVNDRGPPASLDRPSPSPDKARPSPSRAFEHLEHFECQRGRRCR